MMRYLLGAGSAAALLLAAVRADAGCTVNRVAELPVTMAGLTPMVSARINGKDVRFIADSGAFYSSLTPGTAAELGLRLLPAPMGFTVSGIGGTTVPRLAKVQDFRIAGATIPMEFMVVGSEVGGAGLLGQNLLGFRDVEFDLGGGMIRLMDAHDCGQANLAYWAGTKPVAIVPLEHMDRLHDHIVGTVLVNGVRVRATFDTGASTTVLSLEAAARAGVKPGMPGVTSAGYSRGIGRGVAKSWIAPFASFDIGGEQILKTRLRIVDMGAGAPFDMLVGADFFLSHRIYVAKALRQMFVTYQGGPVFSLADDHPPSAPAGASAPLSNDTEPSDADGLARRAAILTTRRDYPQALAELDRAVALAPDDARYVQQRAAVHLALKQPFLAMADLDRALTLKPDLIEARIQRAVLRERGQDRAGARADLDAAAAAAAPQADARLAIGVLYGELNAFEPSVDNLDLWIKAHPEDSSRPTALNDRCWTRARWGRDLDRALADCDAALHARPGTAAFLDSRGLVQLRLGHPDKAIRDYDQALAQEPRLAWSLYGRGLAHRKLGEGPAGDADIAAAVAIRPAIAEDARRYGLAP